LSEQRVPDSSIKNQNQKAQAERLHLKSKIGNQKLKILLTTDY